MGLEGAVVVLHVELRKSHTMWAAERHDAQRAKSWNFRATETSYRMPGISRFPPTSKGTPMSFLRLQARPLLHAFLLVSLGAVASVAPLREAKATQVPDPLSLSGGNSSLQVQSVLPINNGTIALRSTEVRIKAGNNLDRPFSGKLQIAIATWSGRSDPLFELPISIAPRETTSVQVPIVPQRQNGRLHVTLADASGKALNEVDVSIVENTTPALLDIHAYTAFAGSFDQGNNVLFRERAQLARPASENPSKGDAWILPQTHTGYSSVTAALVDLSTLASLSREHAEALIEWVDRGGTLAVIADEPELFRAAQVERILGKGIVENHASGATMTRVLSLAHATNHPEASSPKPVDPRRLVNVPRAFEPKHVRHDFAGPDVNASPYGAARERGLGHIELLAFDPHDTGIANDTFLRAKMYALVMDARDRARMSLTTLSSDDLREGQSLRRALDPNEGFRFGLAFAAGLLCIYAILVGPVLFLRARKRGNPLSPYVVAPLMSGVTFAAILMTGSISRGLSGGARRIALVEHAAGEAHGSEVLFRGFYPPNATTMDIRAEGKGALLDLGMSESDAVADEQFDYSGFAKGESGMRVFGVRTRPWRTFVAREERTYQGAGTVQFETIASTDVTVTNTTARTIRRPFVSVPGRGVFYIGRSIGPGQSVRATDGTFVFAHYYYAEAQTFRAHELESALTESERKAFKQSWGALEELRPSMNFWPRNHPVLIGELDEAPEGDAPKSDSGLAIRKSVVLLRVVGRDVDGGKQ